MSIPSPISTGGGGDHFEQHVAAFALGLLLTRATPPILIDTSVVEVHLQTKHLGWHTDDILIVGENSSGGCRKLAAQVKRTFTVSANNDDCCETVQGMWDDFLAGDRFASSTDQLAIVTLPGKSTQYSGISIRSCYVLERRPMPPTLVVGCHLTAISPTPPRTRTMQFGRF